MFSLMTKFEEVPSIGKLKLWWVVFELRDAISRKRCIISRYWLKSEGGGSLSANFKWKSTSLTNPCWCQTTRLITLSCGIKISAVCFFVSSQSTRVTDGQTDGRTKLLFPRLRRAVKTKFEWISFDRGLNLYAGMAYDLAEM